MSAAILFYFDRFHSQTHNNNDTLAARVDLDATDAPAVLASNVTDVGHALDDLDETLAGVLVLVEAGNVRGAHRLGEGRVQDRNDAREPGGDVGDERELELGVAKELAEVVGGLTLVDVVGERVGADRAGEVLLRLQTACQPK